MKTLTFIIISLLSGQAVAFSKSSFTGMSVEVSVANSAKNVLTMEYIPDGISKEQWKKIKEQERTAKKGKNLGTVGITTFKSRSFAEWQASGGKNLFPVDPKKVKDPKQIPYMQRPGGAPDDSDLKKNPFGNIFKLGKKKEEPAPEQQKKPNWWNLS